MPHTPPELLRARLTELQGDLAALLGVRDAASPAALRSEHHIRILAAMLETIPVGVVVADADGRIFMGNGVAEAMFGHPIIYSEGTGEYRAWEAYHADGRRVESHEYPLSRVIDEGLDTAELEAHYARPDGSRLWIRIIGRPVRDSEGRLIAAAVAVVDIDAQRAMEEQHRVMIGELHHRMKNMTAVMRSLVSQTLRRADVPAQVIETVSDRLDAYGSAQAQLMRQSGHGGRIADLARETLRVPLLDGRIALDGPEVILPERSAMALAMALYELMTNAQKHGALSTSWGTVAVDWRVGGADPDVLTIEWRERGGPALSGPPDQKHTGFGSLVIDRAICTQMRGQVAQFWEADGYRWQLTAPLETGPARSSAS